MTRYPCPDCEDALGPCSGFGCPAKGMETPGPVRVVLPETATNCDGCGDTFLRVNGRQRFCQRSCSERARRREMRRKCEVCGNTYIATRSEQKRCSAECTLVARLALERYMRGIRPPRPCDVCGTAYEPRAKTCRTCSEACRAALDREYSREHKRRMRSAS